MLQASVLAIVPALAGFGALIALDAETLRAPPDALQPLFLAYSVLAAPAIETAAMLAVAALLAHFLPGRAQWHILAVALIASLAHGLGGNWRQALNAAWPMLVYAAVLILWLRRSAIDAMIVTTVVHALYNAAFVAVGVLGSISMGYR